MLAVYASWGVALPTNATKFKVNVTVDHSEGEVEVEIDMAANVDDDDDDEIKIDGCNKAEHKRAKLRLARFRNIHSPNLS